MRQGIFTIILLATLYQSYGQKTLHDIITGQRGVSKKFVTLSADEQRPFSFQRLKSALDLDKQSDLALINQQADKLGFTHYRFHQTYKGIPIENSMYIAHVQNGKLLKLTGEIVVEFDEYNDYSSHPGISVNQAIDAAMKNVNAQTYMWQDAAMERRIKEQTGNTNASYSPTATLVWYSGNDEIEPRDLRLAYKVDIYAKQPLSRADYFIDAQTGTLLGKKDKIFYSDVTGTAATAYSGSQTIHSDLNGTTYRLRDYTKGNGVITLHGESAQRGVDYSSSSANWSLSGTDQAALDAHYGVSQTYSFYMTNFSRNSYDNNGSILYSYVNDPTYLDNAFWDGSAMNFNKRSTGAPGGVTGIDVTGHELTHGVTQTTSGLTYSGESGAMNESMSDIMGKSVQFWSKPADVNWRLSNDMNWLIRDMSNPNSFSQPDTYKGTYWYTGTADNGGVHTNSGVGNFMFYLLVTGGSGTNDIGSNFSVTGIGLSKADQIIYRSETVYLSPSSQYSDWRTACINAATDLYGSSSNELIQVENAWYAVGIGTAGGGGGGISCNTPSGLTTSSITSTGATLSWAPVSGAVNYNLQWKPTSSSTWTPVNGLASTSYPLTGLTASTNYQFQVQTVCSGASSSFSAATSFTTSAAGAITYCASKGTSQTYEWIKQVTFGTINNTTGSNGGYGNFTNLSTNVTAGSTYAITLKPGYSGRAYRQYWTVYIDYNQNGTLNNSGETVVTASSTTTNGLTANITIPTSAKSGATRMRIQMHYGSQVTNPCSTFNYGEVEDYTINISGGSGFTTLSSPSTDADQIASIIIAPNPVSGSNAMVNYHLPASGSAMLRVVDLSGRTLQTVELGNQASGAHTYTLQQLDKISLGNYVLLLEQNSKIVARNPFVIAR